MVVGRVKGLLLVGRERGQEIVGKRRLSRRGTSLQGRKMALRSRGQRMRGGWSCGRQVRAAFTHGQATEICSAETRASWFPDALWVQREQVRPELSTILPALAGRAADPLRSQGCRDIQYWIRWSMEENGWQKGWATCGGTICFCGGVKILCCHLARHRSRGSAESSTSAQLLKPARQLRPPSEPSIYIR